MSKRLTGRARLFAAAVVGGAVLLAPASAMAVTSSVDLLARGLVGSPWRVTAGQPNFGSRITDIEVDPGDSSFVVASIDGGHYFASTDAGQTWRDVDTPAGGLSSLAIWRSGGNRAVYVAGDRGLYRSSDDGAHWEQVTSVSGRVTIVSSILLYSTPGQLWRSRLPAINWTRFAFPDEPGIGLAYEWSHDGTETILTAGISISQQRLVVSRRVGDGSFSPTNFPAAAHEPWRFVADPNSSSVFVAAVGVWRSDDAGANWQAASPGAGPGGTLTPHGDPSSIFPLFTNIQTLSLAGQQVLFTSGHAGVAVSADRGQTWTPLENAVGPPALPSFGFVTALPRPDGLHLVGAIPSALVSNLIPGISASLLVAEAGLNPGSVDGGAVNIPVLVFALVVISVSGTAMAAVTVRLRRRSRRRSAS